MASPVSIQVLGSAKADKVVTLSETLIRRASLKASRWKELKAAKKGGFGSVSRGGERCYLIAKVSFAKISTIGTTWGYNLDAFFCTDI